MSAPTLHPTARMRPVLLEYLERQRGDYLAMGMGMTIFAVYQRMGSSEVDYRAVICGFLLAGLLPALRHERPPAWDVAMPVAPRRFALVRLVSGVVQAAFILAVATGLYAVLFAHRNHPGWYPLALFAWGLTGHLLISATFLGAIHPAVAVPCLGVVVGGYLLAGSGMDPAELRQMGVWEVLARTALPLGLAGAAAYFATRFPARAPEPARPATPSTRELPAPAAQLARAPQRTPAGAPSTRSTPRLVRRGGAHRPSHAVIVFRRHFALLHRFAILPALALLVFVLVTATEPILDVNQGREGPTFRSFVESTAIGEWCAAIALSWTVLVWLHEHGAQRKWNNTLPVGTAKRRVLHAAAGAAWLLLFLTFLVAAPVGRAVAAGMLASPADAPVWLWFGIPCRTLTLYLVATLVLFGTRLAYRISPLVTYVLVALKVDRVVPLMMILMSIGIVAVPYASFVLGIDLLDSLARNVERDAGSSAASALWLVLYAVSAASAVALNDWIHHRDRLPTLPEVRDFFHGWAGTRPAPPLRGDPGR